MEISMKELYILGAGGHGRVVLDIAESMKKYERIRLFDDKPEEAGKGCGGSSVEGTRELLVEYAQGNSEAEAFVAIGSNEIRQRVQEYLEQKKVAIATLIHKNAVLSGEVQLGSGTVVMPGVVVNCGSILGKGIILNTACSVDHDNRIGNYCHISVGSHLAGTVTVGSRTMIGAGAIVKNDICICSHCMIGAGAVVVEDIRKPGTYIGVPAKLRKMKVEEKCIGK